VSSAIVVVSVFLLFGLQCLFLFSDFVPSTVLVFAHFLFLLRCRLRFGKRFLLTLSFFVVLSTNSVIGGLIWCFFVMVGFFV